MIIRPIRNNEKHKRDMLLLTAFGIKSDVEQFEKE